MSDARWFEINAAVTAAIRHFTGAADLFTRLPGMQTTQDKYGFEMGFMHAMQAGQTSMEAALLRVLALFREEAPSGPCWHADLIDRAANPLGQRPAILGPQAARAANETRQFRSIAAHAYDTFDHTRAVNAVESAKALVTLLPADLARFRQAVDP